MKKTLRIKSKTQRTSLGFGMGLFFFGLTSSSFASQNIFGEVVSGTAPKATLMNWVDLGVLFIALSLASFLVLKARSRAGLFLLTLASLAYFGFWRMGSTTSVGSLQNIFASISTSGYGIPLIAIVLFILPLLFTFFFGRIFCSSICPLGAIQEVVAIKPIKVPKLIEKTLSLFPYFYLGFTILFVVMGAGFLLSKYDPFVSFFQGTTTPTLLMIGGGILLVGIFVARPYCRFICPYGVLLGWVSKFSRTHVTITTTECIQCTLCIDTCPYNAINEPISEIAPENRRTGIHRMGILFILLPLFIIIGSISGVLLKEPIAQLHPTVQLAERVAKEEIGFYVSSSAESKAFYATKKTKKELYVEITQLKKRYAVAGGLFGAFVGLIIGLKLISASILRHNKNYEPNKLSCFSCARCFKACPTPHTDK